MLLGQRKISINYCCQIRADYILFSDSTTIRSYQFYISKDIAYNINPNISEKYAKYIRYSYICKLASNINKFDHTFREQKK